MSWKYKDDNFLEVNESEELEDKKKNGRWKRWILRVLFDMQNLDKLQICVQIQEQEGVIWKVEEDTH